MTSILIIVEHSSICWRGRRELITDVRKPEIMVMTSLWAESGPQLLRSPSQTCHAKPDSNQQAPDATQLLSRWWDAHHREQLGLKDFSRKVRTLWHCSRLRSVALYLWLIVVISVRQSTVAAISGLHCRALVMVSSSIKADSLIAKFKEAGGTVREIDVWASHRDYLRSGYLHHRLPVMGC